MTFNLSNPIGEGSDEELLVLTRAAIASILATGQAYAADGRQLTRADLSTLRETVTWLEQRIAADAGDSTVNLARLKRR